MDEASERFDFYDKPEKASKEIFRKLRAAITNDVKPHGKDTEIIQLQTFQKFTACLLSLVRYPDEFKEMYKSAIIDLDMKNDLERSNVINWCRTAKQLYPMKTTGDGNCLLHAVSLYMWGVEDTDQFLRRLLYLNITTDGHGMFKKRWLAYQRQSLDNHRLNVRINTEEYRVEWQTVIQGTVDTMRVENHGLPYTALESIHLYILSNILHRPIIVLADRTARNVYGQSLQENEIGGIYLPLESPPAICHKNPIVIGYNLNHFAPLLFEESDFSLTDSMQVVPLISKDVNSLRVHYLLANEEAEAQKLITDYMTVNEVVYTGKDGALPIPAAQIKHEPLPRDLNIMNAFRLDSENVYMKLTGVDVTRCNRQPFEFERKNVDRITVQNVGGVRQVNILPSNAINIVQGEVILSPSRKTSKHRGTGKEKKCLAMGCNMFGHPETGWYCSKCFKKGTIQYHKQEEEMRRLRRQNEYRNNTGHTHGIDIEQEAITPAAETTRYRDVSIMGEDCHAGCGFKCSTETYPYCHECYPRFGPVVQQQAQRKPDQQEVQLSMLPDSCINEGCMYKCSEATKPFCHQCYDQVTLLHRNVDPTAPIESVPYIASGSGSGNSIGHNQQTERSVQEHNPLHHMVNSQDETAVMNIPAGQGMHGRDATPTPKQMYVPMETSEGQGTEGQLAKKCKMVGCQKKAVKGNNGMCESCYSAAMFGAGTDVCQSPPDEQNAGLLQQICKSPNCREKANPDVHQCVNCFLKNGELPPSSKGHIPMNIVVPEDGEKIMNGVEKEPIGLKATVETPAQQQVGTPTAVQLQTQRQAEYGRKQKCVTEGCHGVHLDNEYGLCDNCYSKVHGKHDLNMSDPFASYTPELTKQEVEKLNPIIVSSKQKMKCMSPFCEEMIYPPKSYCEDCLSALQQSRAKKSLEDNKETAVSNQELCKTKGCLFYGNPELNGFCSQCFSGKADESERLLKGVIKSAPLRVREAAIDEPKHKSTPLVPKSSKYSSKLCVVPGCMRYGDPSQYDRCSQHYQEAIYPQGGEYNGPTVSLRHALNPQVPQGSPVAEKPVDPFIQSISKVEGNFKAKDLCKNNLRIGCQNYGNAKNRGYCNRCYPDIQRKELHQQLAMAGGNRFG